METLNVLHAFITSPAVFPGAVVALSVIVAVLIASIASRWI